MFRQPETDEERVLAEEAKNECPVQAIGSDGVPEEMKRNPESSGVESFTPSGSMTSADIRAPFTERDERVRVVVLGVGFGGLTFCQTFSAPDANITLVDRQNHRLFQPLLYQVATAGLSAPEIAQPIRSILFRRKHVEVLLANVTGVHLTRREVRLNHTVMTYDHLVLALGGVTSHLDHPEWEQHAPGLKSLGDALPNLLQLLLVFERAETAIDASKQARLMAIVVLGGGATGVGLVGAFDELARRVLKREFRRIAPPRARVILLDAGPRLLPQFSEQLAAKAARRLTALGVDIHTHSRVRCGVARRVRARDGV